MITSNSTSNSNSHPSSQKFQTAHHHQTQTHRHAALLHVDKKKKEEENIEDSPTDGDEFGVEGNASHAPHGFLHGLFDIGASVISNSWIGKRRPVRKIEQYIASLQMIRNAYQPQTVIGANVFAKSLSQQLTAKVLKSSNVQTVIEKLRSQSPTLSKKQLEDRAYKILYDMGTDFNERTLRGFAWIIQNVLQQLYKGIHVSQKELIRVREVAMKAQSEGIPLVLLPTHKSHVDYMVVSYIFFLCNLSLPFIAAGDNLMLPLIGQLLRSSGAFFIRRKFDKDKLYRVIFNEYIEQILCKGYNLEFFLEGGRSRTGKLLQPKMGILSVIVEAVLSGRLKDAYFLPISIAYDKVIETEQYVKELLGAAKEPESIGMVIRSTELLKFNFGRIDVRIAQPFSLKEYLNEQIQQRKLNVNIKEHMRTLIQVLAYSILYRINKASVTMPTAIIVSILLTHRGRGISRKDLIRKYEWLRDQIKKRGGKVATPDTPYENTGQLIDTSLNVLGNLVGRQKNVLEPVFTPLKRFELSYYRNQLLHLFVNEGLVACSLYSHVRLSASVGVDKTELLKDVIFLSQLLKIEIIYLPSPDISTTYHRTISEMVERGIIALDSSHVLKIAPNGLHQFDFLCALFWPFIDSYWLMSCSLYSLCPIQIIEEKNFLQKVQSLGFTLYYEGELNYYESVSKETLSNALILFQTLGIIDKQAINESGVNIIKLQREYQDEDKLISFIEQIGKMRREAKYASYQYTFSSNLKEIIQLSNINAKPKL